MTAWGGGDTRLMAVVVVAEVVWMWSLLLLLLYSTTGDVGTFMFSTSWFLERPTQEVLLCIVEDV